MLCGTTSGGCFDEHAVYSNNALDNKTVFDVFHKIVGMLKNCRDIKAPE